MKQCEDYNEINLYNTLVKKINEIIDELNKVDLQKLEMQRLLNTAYEIKNDLTKIYMDDKQVLDTIDNNLKDVKDSVKLIKLLNIENKINRLVKEFEGNHIILTGSKNGVLEIESIHGNTLWVDNGTEEILNVFDDSKNLRIQSSFEDKVVTQDMVDSEVELAENLGKYKVDYKVTGKNKFDKSKAIDGYELFGTTGGVATNPNWFITDYIKVIPNTSYKISGKTNGHTVCFYDENKTFISSAETGIHKIDTLNNAAYVRLNGLLTQKDTFQLEEGSTATTYEPYKEQIKTYYLNSPLLEGDTIEQQGTNLVHVHRYGKIVLDGNNNYEIIYHPGNSQGNTALFTVNINDIMFVSDNCICDKLKVFTGNIWNYVERNDSECINTKHSTSINRIMISILKSKLSSIDEVGFKTYLQFNPITVICKLVSPTVEVIGENEIDIMECFEGCSINYDTVIPVKKTKVIYTGKEEITTYAMEDDISLNDSGIELNSNDEEVF